MNYYLTTVTYITTGAKSITVGFQPVAAKITIGPKSGSTSILNDSEGCTDGTNQITDFRVQHSGRSYSERFNNRLGCAWEWDTGLNTWVEKVKVALPGSGSAFTATQFNFDALTVNSGYQCKIEVWG